MVYQWKDGSRIKLDPQAAGKALAKLRDKGGRVNGEDVVKEARGKRSPLHNHFDWDDTSAAHTHRIEQAQLLIRCLVVIVKGGDRPSQVFYGIRRKDETEYVHRAAVMRSRALADDLLAQAKRDMRRFILRYEEIKSDLKDVFGAIDELLDD